MRSISFIGLSPVPRSRFLSCWLALAVLAAGCSSHSETDEESNSKSPRKRGRTNTAAGEGGGGGSAGRDGESGSGSTITGRPEDGGTDAGESNEPADKCADVANACDEASVRCMGNTLVTCAENADGCLVTTRRSCTRGGTNFCDDTLDPPACAIDPCASVANACQNEGRTCSGTTLVDCAKNADGCLVAKRTNCATVDGKNACGGTPAECTFDPCRDDRGQRKADVCATPQDSCAGDYWVHCVPDADGCPIATRTDCTREAGKNICDAKGETPQCGFDPCRGVTNCLTAGKTCDGVNLVDCAPNQDGCLVKTTTDCTQNRTTPNTCDASGGTPVCTVCRDAEACVGKAEGDAVCDGNVFQRCTDSDGDTCLNAVRTDCGANFTCDADPAKRCVFSGADMCSSPIAATLREPMSYGPFDTTGAGNEYSGYQCPGIFFSLAAASPDLLFALDIEPKTVATIALTNPSGFTGDPPAFVVLTRCGDDAMMASATAEASCRVVSDTTGSYTNDRDSATRVYVVVDATRLNNADNVGMFGLTLDTHPLKCGDGKRDGAEACDDGNVISGDGCTPACTAEMGFSCTSTSPSVCTKRPTDGICANVVCPAIPADAPANTQTCCTNDQRCGLSYGLLYGAACFVRDQPGKAADACPDEESVFTPLIGALDGCCRPDNTCGVIALSGAGCVERTQAWSNMAQGFGGFLYSGPFERVTCTYE